MRDQASNISVQTSLAPAARTATANGTGVSVANVDAATISIEVGVITDGVHAPSVQESADNVTWNNVAAANLTGALAGLASNTNQRVGYIGIQPYVRVVTTITGAPVTGGVYTASVILGHPRKAPLA